MKFVLSTLALLAACFTAGATDCRRVVHVRQVAAVVHHQAAYVAPVAAVAYYPAAVYSVGYNSGGAESALKFENLQLQIELQKREMEILRRDLQQGNGKPGGGGMGPTYGQPQASANIHPGVAYLTQACAKCHDSSVSAKMGMGFTMFNGGRLIDLSDKAKLKIVSEIGFQRMPKGGPKLNQEEFNAVMALLDTRPTAPEQIKEPPTKSGHPDF